MVPFQKYGLLPIESYKEYEGGDSNSLIFIEGKNIYTDANKAKLNLLLTEQAGIKSELETIELEWFELEEQIEAIREEFTA